MEVNEVILKGVKTGNTIVFNDKKAYTKFLETIGEGSELVITISKKRSKNQNALFHKWISIISDHTGESFDVMKVWIVSKFFGYVEKEIEGHIYTIPVQTSKLSKKEFAAGMTLIEAWAYESLMITLPQKDI